jgi:hypothetical protein
VEEEACSGYLADGELWIFTNNLMAESCFFKGGLSLKLLHELVIHLKKLSWPPILSNMWSMLLELE